MEEYQVLDQQCNALVTMAQRSSSKSYRADGQTNEKLIRAVLAALQSMHQSLQKYILNMRESMVKRMVVSFLENWVLVLSLVTLASFKYQSEIRKKIPPEYRGLITEVYTGIFVIVASSFVVDAALIIRPQKLKNRDRSKSYLETDTVAGTTNVVGLYLFLKGVLPALVDTSALPKVPPGARSWGRRLMSSWLLRSLPSPCRWPP